MPKKSPALNNEIEEIYNACRDYLNLVEKFLKIPKKEVLQKTFNISDIRGLKKEIEQYFWGVLEALESYVGFPNYLFEEISISARAPQGSENTSLIKKAVAIQKAYNEAFNEEPQIDELKKLWQQGFLKFFQKVIEEEEGNQIFETFESFLAKRNIFVIYFRGASISGLATKNFIFINKDETKSRKIWTLFHELLHILEGDFGFRTPRDSKERFHEDKVGEFLIKDFLPKSIEAIQFKELEAIAEQIRKDHPIPLHKYAIEKWISKRKGWKLRFTPFRPKKRKETSNNLSLIFSQKYLEKIESIKDRDLELFAALQGKTLEELLLETPQIVQA